MTTESKLIVLIRDLNALVEPKKSDHLTILFPECRIPEICPDDYPNEAHRFGIRILAKGNKPLFDIPPSWGDQHIVRMSAFEAGEYSESYDVWFPENCDFRICNKKQTFSARPDTSELRSYLVSMNEIYEDRLNKENNFSSCIDPALLEFCNKDKGIEEKLDGRLFIEGGTLTTAGTTPRVDYWDTTEGNDKNSCASLQKEIAEAILWDPQLSDPVLQGKLFHEDNWQTILKDPPDAIEFINSPPANYLAMSSDPKFAKENTPQEIRSKHLVLFHRLFKKPIKPTRFRIPYYEPDYHARQEGTEIHYICSKLHIPEFSLIGSQFCPPMYFNE